MRIYKINNFYKTTFIKIANIPYLIRMCYYMNEIFYQDKEKELPCFQTRQKIYFRFQSF